MSEKQRITIEIDHGPSWADYHQRVKEHEVDVYFLGGDQIRVHFVGTDSDKSFILRADTPQTEGDQWGDYIASNDRQIYHAIRNFIHGVEFAIDAIRIDRSIGEMLGVDRQW